MKASKSQGPSSFLFLLNLWLKTIFWLITIDLKHKHSIRTNILQNLIHLSVGKNVSKVLCKPCLSVVQQRSQNADNIKKSQRKLKIISLKTLIASKMNHLQIKLNKLYWNLKSFLNYRCLSFLKKYYNI